METYLNLDTELGMWKVAGTDVKKLEMWKVAETDAKKIRDVKSDTQEMMWFILPNSTKSLYNFCKVSQSR